MVWLLIQFAAEVLRALLIDELSYRVRLKLGELLPSPRIRGTGQVLMAIHRRNRKRLLHKLLTGDPDEL